MKKIVLALLFTTLVVSPAAAGGFSIFGSYWNTSDADAVGGGGVRVGIPLGSALSLDLRGTYYEELKADPLAQLGDLDSPFEKGIKALPLDAGLRIDFANHDVVNPYVGGGGTYYILDSDSGNVKDEVGWYVQGGIELHSFFVEADYRKVTATVEREGHVGDLQDHVDIDLSGVCVNAGWNWTF